MADIGKVRIRIPSSIKPGEVVQVRTLVIQPMERIERDREGRIIPKTYNYINKVIVTYLGKTIVTFDTTQSVSENPFFSFAFRATDPGPLKVEFLDPTGGRYEGAVDITFACAGADAFRAATLCAARPRARRPHARLRGHGAGGDRPRQEADLGVAGDPRGPRRLPRSPRWPPRGDPLQGVDDARLRRLPHLRLRRRAARARRRARAGAGGIDGRPGEGTRTLPRPREGPVRRLPPRAR